MEACNSYKNMSSIVNYDVALSRAFAAIGLLRKVKAATPNDLICTYIVQTDQLGFKCAVLSKLYEHKYHTSQQIIPVSSVDTVERPISFPDGIVKMSKRYLIRKFWSNIDTITKLTYTDNCQSGRLPNVAKGAKIYPKQVLDVLGRVHVHPNSSIWEARHAISDLHSVVTPIMFDRPAWKDTKGRTIQNSFGTMENKHVRNLNTLKVIGFNYCWNSGNRNSIPNDAEKDILLDLIESILILEGESFTDAFNIRQVYECARLGNVYSPNQIEKELKMRYTYRRFSTQCTGYNDVPAFLLKMQNLSPEAAICLDMVNGHYDNESTYAIAEYSNKSVSAPIPEVVAYLRIESIVAREKLELIAGIKKELKCSGDDTLRPTELCE